jgi:hypothetical protein
VNKEINKLENLGERERYPLNGPLLKEMTLK